MPKFISTERIPEWAICYLLYEREDNLFFTDEDKDMVDAWVKQNFPHGFIMEPHQDLFYTEEYGPQSYFTPCPAFGKACYVIDMDFYEP